MTNRPEWEPCNLGENPLEDLTEIEFAESLDAFREIPFTEVNWKTQKNWVIRYLDEAERRWRPQNLK